jgi:predicted permease
LGGLFRKRRSERDLADEIDSHLQLHIADNLHAGMNPEDARRQALLKLGGVESTKESYRDRRGIPMLETLLQDLRYGLRTLRRSPGFTSVAVLSLALGIGANTAIFSLMNAMILRSLPIRDPGQLVRLSTTTPQNPDSVGYLSLAMYQQLRRDQRVFSDLFAWSGGGIMNVEANGTRYAASTNIVTGEYFSTVGVQPHLGRLITPDDLSLQAGSPAAVAVLSYGCWKGRYNGDPAIVGKTIRVDDRPLTIIGVTPESFSGLIIDVDPDVTIPIGYSGGTTYRDRKNLILDVWARLKPGITMEQARAQLESVWPAIRLASLPEGYVAAQREEFLAQRIGLASAATGHSFLRQRYRRPLFVLMAMVGLLLLIACVNLANLVLARAASRRQELGIRVALGASKWRIIRQMLTESLMLSATGAALGLVIAYLASRLLLNTMWSGLVPLTLDAAPDIRVLAFTAFISLLTGLLFGASPAWNIFRTDPAGNLQQNSRTVHVGASTPGKVLISAQVALSLVLVIGAVLFVRSLEKLRTVDVGFRRDGVLMLHLFPQSGAEGQHMPNRVPYYQELAERMRRIPGVESVSYSHMGPVLFYEYKESASVPSSLATPAQAVFEMVGPGFFHLAGMHLLAGREFDWHDGEAAQPVAIISESLSRRLFPSENPIGKTLNFGDRKGLEIVGVVNSASLWMPQSREPMAVYVAFLQQPAYNSSFIDIRTTGDPAAIQPTARLVLASLGRHVAIRAETLEQRAGTFLSTERMIAMLSSFFGGLALLLASVGLYGLMSYAVARRTAEIGLRMALGAQPARVLRLIIKEVMWLVLAGMAVGIPAALAASRLVSGMVFGVGGNDPLTTLLSSAILVLAALLAGYVPAHRASCIDPMTALRSE